MAEQLTERPEVLIIGAGPTGLVLALWLTAQDVKVRIVDKSAGPGTSSRAMAVQARTLELYRQLGMGDAVAAAGHQSHSITMWANGKKRAHLDMGHAGENMTPYPFTLVYPQDRHEAFLVERLGKLGIEVERSIELVDFDQDEHGVMARLRRADGEIETCRAGYLAGCDGARSAVRHQLGIAFDGGTYEQTFYVADVETHSDAVDQGVQIAFQGSDFVLVLPYDDSGKVRLIGTVRAEQIGKTEGLSFEDVSHKSIDAIGLNVEKVNWFSSYRVHHRLAERFRHGRAFLLGDAAHIHSPAGGQGMNTGIGDAINLAWKLAAVLQGRADDRLLESFEAERPVFARKLVQVTDRAFTLVTRQGEVASFLRTHVAPLFAKAAYSFTPTKENFFRLISQITLSYPESPLSVGKAGDLHGGERFPYLRFGGGDNYDALLAIAWQVHVYGVASDELRSWCEDQKVSLQEFEWREEFKQSGLAENAAYVLRPDTYIGLAEPNGSAKAVAAYFSEHGIRAGS